jgi:hypothetical protein
MALETLKGVEEIGGFKVVDMNAIREKRPEMFRPDGSMIYHLFDNEIRPYNFIYVRHDVNSISFNIQRGPIQENGVNGCQVDTMIETAKVILEKLNEGAYRCRENSCAITHLDEALHWLEARRLNRVSRGVEGSSKP